MDETTKKMVKIPLTEVQHEMMAELSQRDDCTEVIPKAAIIEGHVASMLFFETERKTTVAVVYHDGEVAWEDTNHPGWNLPVLN